jgi:ADP-ribose pyrophosphatase YjhB (NUDIX family)
MPISPHIRALRAYVGTMRLLLPSVSAHIFDDRDRLLLVQQTDSGEWSTPGGALEPDERPADAVAREVWEETGLVVIPDRLLGVYGGPEFVVNYPNGDEVQYAIMAFGCRVAGGELRPDGDETNAVRYFSAAEAAALPLTPWLRSSLDLVFGAKSGNAFHPPTWTPPLE